MHKYRTSDVKSFEFSDLKGTHVITQSDFKSFSFEELSGETTKADKISEETLRTERSFEKKNNFKIDSVVRDSRGLSRQENTDLESRIQAEVSRRLEDSYKDAYNEGIEKGREEGKAQAFLQYQEELNLKIDGFVEIISEIQSQSVKLIDKNRHEIYSFVKQFTKWIILKEVNEKVYLETLLEKLILELNARKNLVIKVGRANFDKMPEVVKVVEERLGQLSNLRIEIGSEIQHPGILLESENGLIDGTLEGVFKNIDKIFEQVVKHE